MANQNGGRAQALGSRQSESKWGGDTPKDAKRNGLDPREVEDPAVALRRLEGFNPSLKTASWRIFRHERPQEAKVTGGLKHLLVV